MIIFKCNRCKKELTFMDYKNQKYDIFRNRLYNTSDSNSIEGEETLHLCPECTEAFDKFLEGGDIKCLCLDHMIRS